MAPFIVVCAQICFVSTLDYTILTIIHPITETMSMFFLISFGFFVDSFKFSVVQLGFHKVRISDPNSSPGASMKNKSTLIKAGVAFASLVIIFIVFLLFRNQPVHSLIISEVCSSNSLVSAPDGYCLDYIEIYNDSETEIQLNGYALLCNKESFSFAENTVITPHAYLVIWCGEKGDAPFALSREGGETIALINSRHTILDSMVTQPTEKNQAMIRTSSGDWIVTSQLTPGTDPAHMPSSESLCVSHHDPSISPVRINEVAASNLYYPDEAGAYPDFIELYNTSDIPVDISGFTLSDDPSKCGHRFADGTTLDGNGYLLLFLNDFFEFSLSKEGNEALILRDKDDRLIDQFDTPTLDDNTYACVSSTNDWILTSEATPGFENSPDGRYAYLVSMNVLPGKVGISEFMVSNKMTTLPGTLDTPDWIELCSFTDTDIDLTGWYLSDSLDNPLKQSLQGQILPAMGYLLIPCQEFSLSSSGEEIILLGPGSCLVDHIIYSPEDALSSDASQSSVPSDLSFQRVWDAEHTLTSPLTTTFLVSPGLENTKAGYAQYCESLISQGDLAIWEVMTANDWYLRDNYEYFDWVELKNISDHEVSLSSYSLTDDADLPDQYIFPDITLQPGELYTVLLTGEDHPANADSKYLHIPFGLDAAKDHLYLFSIGSENGYTISDQVLLRDIPFGMSYGRLASLGGFFYMPPSPKEENITGQRCISDAPTADTASGVYNDTASLTISLSGCGDLFYTLDSSDPTVNSIPYTAPIEITESTILRVINVEPDCIPSNSLTLSYILNENDTLPVVSLVCDPSKLATIYRGNEEVKVVELPAHISYYGDDGTFDLNCGISMHGATSLRISPKKSFTVRFKDRFDGTLNYDLFENGEITNFSSILLRADVESTYPSMIRDALYGHLALECTDNLYGMDYKYSAFYLNGEFFGIYVIREHASKEYYASHTGYPVDTCTMIKSFPENGDSLYAVTQWAKAHDLADSDNYDYVRSIIDVESWADWMILEAYVGNIDIYENMRYFYSSEDGLWKCCIYDVDLGMFGTDTFSAPLGSMQSALPHALIQNKDFCHLLTERLSYWLNGPLKTEVIQDRIDSMAAEFRDEMPKESERWGCPLYVWEGYVTELKDYCVSRPAAMIYGLRDITSLSDEDIQYYFPNVKLN